MKVEVMKNAVIFDTSSQVWGGSHIFIDQLCNFLNQNKINTFIASSDVDNYQSQTIKTPSVDKKIVRLLSTLKISKLFKNNNIDVVILNDLSALWLAPMFRMLGFEVIGLLHLFLQKKSSNRLSHSTLEYHLIKFGGMSCNKLFSIGNENLSVFRESDIEVIGNFASNLFFKTLVNTENKIFDFLIVARLSKQKDIVFFIRLLHKLNEYKKRKYNLLIVGKGSEERSINDAISKYNMENFITVSGWASREDLPNIYDSARCFVISSLHEGFATTILESHARGLPALVSSTSGFCVDFINIAPLTGLVFNKEDIHLHKLYESIATLIDLSDDYKKQCISKSSSFNQNSTFKPILDYLK